MEFKEVQPFRLRWAWAGVAVLNLLFLYAIIQQVLVGIPFGPKPAPTYVLILTELFFLFLLWFLYSIKLETLVNERGIYYRLFPFQQKMVFIDWTTVSTAYMRQYSSFYEYGGWGLRTGTPANGNAVNTSASCNIGLQLDFHNGKRLLIGTRKPEELERAIRNYFKM